MNDGRKLLKALIREVVIAGEIETSDLYADYRPDDPKAYLGMVLGVDDDEGAGGDGDGTSGDDTGDDGSMDTDTRKPDISDIDLKPNDESPEKGDQE